jgi:hypothetical protein
MVRAKVLLLGALLAGLLLPGIGNAQTCSLVLNGQCVTDPDAALDDWSYNSTTGTLSINTANSSVVFAVTEPNQPTPTTGPVAINFIRANNQNSLEIQRGSPITISWSVDNATSCSYTGGTSFWQGGSWPDSDSRRSVIVDYVGTRTFGLVCQGEGGPVSAGVAVTGVDTPDDPDTGADSCDNNTTARVRETWRGEFGTSWPGPSYAYDVFVRAPTGNGKSVSFNTGTTVSFGGISNDYWPAGAGTALQRVSISPCQADWDVPRECQWEGNGSFSIVWSTESTPRRGACMLRPNTTYYVNFGWIGTCSTCDHRVQLSNPNLR